MATKDLSIRLSIKDAETVKAALRGVGEEGKEALAALERGSTKSTTELARLEKQVQRVKEQLDPAAKSLRQFTETQATLAAAVSKGVLSQGEANKLLETAGQRYKDTAQGVQAATMGMTGAFGQLRTVAGALGVTFGVAEIVGYTKRVFELVAGLDELAEQIGTTATALQALQYVAVQNGVRVEELEKSLTKFSRTIGEAANGSKDAIEKFKDLGIHILDANKQLRPTEEIMQEAAQAILKIEDPAKRAAAAYDLFGKSGQKMLTMLQDIAKGQGELQRVAGEAGAIVTEENRKRLDQASDATARWFEQMKGWTGNFLGEIFRISDRVAKALADAFSGVKPAVQEFVYDLYGVFGGLIEAVKEIFSGFAGMIGRAFALAMNAAIEQVERALTSINQGIADSTVGKLLGMKGGPVSIGLNKVDPGSGGQMNIGEAWARGFKKAADEARRLDAELEKMNREAKWLEEQFGTGTPGSASPGKGKFDPNEKGAGAEIAKKIDKVIADAELQLKYATLIAETAKKGAGAVEDMELRYATAKKAQDAFGESAKARQKDVEALADKLYKLAKASKEADALKDMRLGTQEIERQTQLMEVELRTMGMTNEQRARELAIVKVRNDLLAKGIDLSKINNDELQKEVDKRIEATTKQEQMKGILEQQKKAMELWQKPFENALQSIQTTISDVFYEIYSGGVKSFKDLASSAKQIMARLAAELTTLMILRPILSPVVSGMAQLGLVSPQMAQQYGVGAAGGYPGGFGGTTGAGVWGSGGTPGTTTGSLFGQSSAFGFLNRGIFGPSASAYEGVIPGMSGSEAAAQFGDVTGGMTWGQGIGGMLGIAAGVAQLATAKQPGQKVAAVGMAVGSALMMTGNPYAMAAGAIIIAVTQIIGMLWKKKPKLQQQVSDIMFNNGQAFSEVAFSSGSMNDSANQAGTQFSDAFNVLMDRYGLSALSGMQGGYLLNSVGANTGNQWIVGLGSYQNGGREIADGIADPEAAMGILAGAILKGGAVSGTLTGRGFTDVVEQILTKATLESMEEIEAALNFAPAYADAIRELTDSVTDSEKAIRDINTTFDSMRAQARLYGLDIEILETRRQETINKFATDMNDKFRKLILGQTPEGQLALALEELDAEKVQAIREAEYVNTVSQVLVDISQIEQYYADQRVEIIRAANEQATANLEELWRRITYGDLSASTPMGTLAGSRASFDAALAQAQAGDLTARSNLAGLAEAFLTAQSQFSGHNTEYGNALAYIQNAIAPFISANNNAGSANPANIDGGILYEQQQQIALLIQTNQDQAFQISELIRELRNANAR